MPALEELNVVLPEQASSAIEEGLVVDRDVSVLDPAVRPDPAKRSAQRVNWPVRRAAIHVIAVHLHECLTLALRGANRAHGRVDRDEQPEQRAAPYTIARCRRVFTGSPGRVC